MVGPSWPSPPAAALPAPLSAEPLPPALADDAAVALADRLRAFEFLETPPEHRQPVEKVAVSLIMQLIAATRSTAELAERSGRDQTRLYERFAVHISQAEREEAQERWGDDLGDRIFGDGLRMCVFVLRLVRTG